MEDLLDLAVAPARTGDGSFYRTVGRVLVIVVAAVVLLVVGLWVKRKIVGEPERDETLRAGGFGVSELRRMHANGELSDDEFARARDKVVAHAKAAARVEDAPPADDRPRGKDLDLIRDAES